MNLLAILLAVILLSCSTDNKASSSEDKKNEKKEVSQEVNNTDLTTDTSSEYEHTKGDHIVEVVKKIDHDPEAYTQGFFYYEGYLYESTGLRGQSSLRKIDPNTGEILKKKPVPGNLFAEGITIYNKNIYQLTWRGGICFVYDMDSFEILENRNYPGEGWGLTTNGDRLIMSDGSDMIRFLDPETFEIVSRVHAYKQNERVSFLNELEYINGEIYANVYGRDEIVRINPKTGEVLGKIDLSPLREYITTEMNVEVLNGIAYDSDKGNLYVTGKNWPFIFLVNLISI